MPKETVHGDPNDRFALDVGWQADCDVQVGIRTVDGKHLVDEFYGEPVVTAKVGQAVRAYVTDVCHISGPAVEQLGSDVQIGRAVLDAVTGSDYGMESLWWHPNRNQINRLIRTLRKARDAAFGSDA